MIVSVEVYLFGIVFDKLSQITSVDMYGTLFQELSGAQGSELGFCQSYVY